MSFIKNLEGDAWLAVTGYVASSRTLSVVWTLLILVLVYAHAFCPLKHLPGPWISRILPLLGIPGWSPRGRKLLQLHQRYGI